MSDQVAIPATELGNLNDIISSLKQQVELLSRQRGTGQDSIVANGQGLFGVVNGQYMAALMATGGSLSGRITTATPNAQAMLNLPPASAAPTDLVDGDVWTQGDGLYVRIGGITYRLVAVDPTAPTLDLDSISADTITGGSITGDTVTGTDGLFVSGTNNITTVSDTLIGDAPTWLVDTTSYIQYDRVNNRFLLVSEGNVVAAIGASGGIVANIRLGAAGSLAVGLGEIADPAATYVVTGSDVSGFIVRPLQKLMYNSGDGTMTWFSVSVGV